MVLLKFGICGSFRGNGQEIIFVVFVLFCCDNAQRSSVFEKNRSVLCVTHWFLESFPCGLFMDETKKREGTRRGGISPSCRVRTCNSKHWTKT